MSPQSYAEVGEKGYLPFAVRVRRAVNAWRVACVSRWVIRNLLQGAQIPWRRRPRFHRAHPCSVTESDQDFARAEIVGNVYHPTLGVLGRTGARFPYCGAETEAPSPT